MGDLAAVRVGDAVRLRWTMPSETTDGQTLTGQRRVTVCRRAGMGVCAQVKALAEMPKAAVEVEDALPAGMTEGAAGLLTYEVEVQNEAGRAAGASNAAYTASGSAGGGGRTDGHGDEDGRGAGMETG